MSMFSSRSKKPSESFMNNEESAIERLQKADKLILRLKKSLIELEILVSGALRVYCHPNFKEKNRITDIMTGIISEINKYETTSFVTPSPIYIEDTFEQITAEDSLLSVSQLSNSHNDSIINLKSQAKALISEYKSALNQVKKESSNIQKLIKAKPTPKETKKNPPKLRDDLIYSRDLEKSASNPTLGLKSNLTSTKSQSRSKHELSPKHISGNLSEILATPMSISGYTELNTPESKKRKIEIPKLDYDSILDRNNETVIASARRNYLPLQKVTEEYYSLKSARSPREKTKLVGEIRQLDQEIEILNKLLSSAVKTKNYETNYVTTN